MAEIKTYKQRIKGGKGKSRYFVKDKWFDDENKARSYYDQLKVPSIEKTTSKLKTVQDGIYDIEYKRTNPDPNDPFTKQDAGMLELLKKREKLLYHQSGIDTTGMSLSGDMSMPVKKDKGWLGKTITFLGGGEKHISEKKWIKNRINEISIELRKMRDSGTLPEGIKPNEINAYARSQAESEWKKQKEEYDPLGIKK